VASTLPGSTGPPVTRSTAAVRSGYARIALMTALCAAGPRKAGSAIRPLLGGRCVQSGQSGLVMTGSK
jgi:hypothetical protein